MLIGVRALLNASANRMVSRSGAPAARYGHGQLPIALTRYQPPAMAPYVGDHARRAETSIPANLTGLIVAAGYRVLAVDLDPQGNLGRDLGYKNDARNDNGRSLLAAVTIGHPLAPVMDVQPGLDVVCGGARVGEMVGALYNRSTRGVAVAAAVRDVLAPVAGDLRPDLVRLPAGGAVATADGPRCRGVATDPPSARGPRAVEDLTPLQLRLTETRRAGPADPRAGPTRVSPPPSVMGGAVSVAGAGWAAGAGSARFRCRGGARGSSVCSSRGSA